MPRSRPIRHNVVDASRFVRDMPSSSRSNGDAYAKLVLSLHPAVYYRMEQPKNEKDSHVVFDLAGGDHHGKLRLGNKLGRSYRPGRWGSAIWFRGPMIGDSRARARLSESHRRQAIRGGLGDG